ncbi:MAG TPA: hypothetical protein DCZ01_06465 [Elusimicrobia bacterium]|nr:MAG: hypothetical protein A2X37_02585 [Elusimicrobia bacterium GWA2_66_18]OGR73012.1 MAG: hypothetical protein A2X40_09725 [Elusimicrobia bacterium GWC2_65_9]HAZ08154.1 hypothetical protein [Elusimicrobiota bacterium]
MTFAALLLASAISSAQTAAVSTGPAAAQAGPGVKAEAEAKLKFKNLLHAVIHPEAKEWEPLSLQAGGDPGQAVNAVVLRQVKVKGKIKGASAKARASARLVRSKDDRWLVVSIFPQALEKRRFHLEVRFRVVEGFIEDAKAAAVFVMDSRPGAGEGLDSFALRAAGVAFQEESPGSGQVLVSALDPRPGKTAFNAGRLKLAEFADADLGFVDASWSVRGLSASP